MNTNSDIRRCILCAWRVDCRKRYIVTDGGARCPDFCRDVTLKNADSDEPEMK